MIYNAFKQQSLFHKDPARYRGLFAGKRSGKTQGGAIECIIHQETKPGFIDDGVDPYLGMIIAPTNELLHDVAVEKVMAYAKSLGWKYWRSKNVIDTDDRGKIKLVSADRPNRIEGRKVSWVWIDEVFQTKEQVWTEAVARVSDTKGRIWCSGSLGVQYNNPKKHWIYKYFKESPMDGTSVHEWGTEQNPYFPQDELLRLKNTLDPKTFRQLYQLSWDVAPTNVVYEDFDEGNLSEGVQYNPNLRTYVAIDWGWSHPMACLFIQYDPHLDMIYVFDEIVRSKMKLEELYRRIMEKPYRINKWICDIAGNQERERSDGSNVDWFYQSPRNIRFNYKKMGVSESIAMVRRYVQNGKGQKKLLINPKTCPVLVDQLLNYSYQEKNGILLEEVIKLEDDAPDALRYFVGNELDERDQGDSVLEFNRFEFNI